LWVFVAEVLHYRMTLCKEEVGVGVTDGGHASHWVDLTVGLRSHLLEGYADLFDLVRYSNK
jgi:hypothetical protein